MKRLIAVFLICALIACFFTGCTNSEITNSVIEPIVAPFNLFDELLTGPDSFQLVGKFDVLSCYRCLVTDVMYLKYMGGYAGGITVMLHPDGTPLLYSEWLEMKEGVA